MWVFLLKCIKNFRTGQQTINPNVGPFWTLAMGMAFTALPDRKFPTTDANHLCHKSLECNGRQPQRITKATKNFTPAAGKRTWCHVAGWGWGQERGRTKWQQRWHLGPHWVNVYGNWAARTSEHFPLKKVVSDQQQVRVVEAENCNWK